MPSEIWWVWMVVAALFFVGEIFTAAFFLLWFGVGAALAGILALISVGPFWQWGVFILVSLVLFAVSRRFAERFTEQQPPGIGADRFIGKMGVVLEEIDNMNNTGRIRIEREEWRAESDEGNTIPPGTKVHVTRVVGTRLVVEILKEEA